MPAGRSTKRRGIQRGIPRHRITSNSQSEQQSETLITKLASKFLKYLNISKYCSQSTNEDDGKSPIQALARLSYRISSYFVFNLCILPMKVHKDGSCTKVSLLRRIIHYFVVSLLVLSMIGKLCLCVHHVAREASLDIRLIISLAGFTLELAAFCVGSGCILLPDDSIKLINSWMQISAHAQAVLKLPQPIESFQDDLVGLKVISLLIAGIIATIQFPAINLFIQGVPIFLQSNLERLNIFQDLVNNSPSVLLTKILCYPLEIFWYTLPVAMLVFSAHIMVLEIGFLKLYLRQLSNLSDQNYRELKMLEHLYAVIQIHNWHLYRWVQICVFPLLMTVGGGVVLCLYIPIKHPEMPAILSGSFFLVGLVTQGVIFWTSYDVVQVIRASEQVIGQLYSISSRYKNLEYMRYFSKRSKALWPVTLPIGSFGKFSIEVPIIMWDEILNQLLFLLGF